MTDTEFVPIAELEVEMTVGELRAVLAADTIERLTKERDEARRLVGLARRLAGAVQRFRNLPGLERSKLRETPEYHDLCERWRVFQDADSAAMKKGNSHD